MPPHAEHVVPVHKRFALPGHVIPAQHGCPEPPQVTHWFDPSQIEPAAHMLPGQHVDPGTPHVMHWFDALHVVPLLQTLPLQHG
jgi:hypothetical protein